MVALAWRPPSVESCTHSRQSQFGLVGTTPAARASRTTSRLVSGESVSTSPRANAMKFASDSRFSALFHAAASRSREEIAKSCSAASKAAHSSALASSDGRAGGSGGGVANAGSSVRENAGGATTGAGAAAPKSNCWSAHSPPRWTTSAP